MLNFVKRVLRCFIMLMLVFALQKVPWATCGEIGLIQIHLSREQAVSDVYELGENDYLELHNRYSWSINEIEVFNELNGKKLVSIQKIEKGQSAKMQFKKGSYTVRYLITDGQNGIASRQFQVEVKAKVVL